jgi:tRNA threonylcarbamoyladenosine biosynthesis protein TsaB
MPSLREVLAAHAPLLCLDAASSRVQVGWLSSSSDTRWQSSDDEAGVAVFRCVQALGCDVMQANALIFCDGPGSILGIRTTAMALRTWNVLRPRPMFAYAGLALVAHAIGDPETTVIADARRDAWHHYRIGGGLKRVPGTELRGRLVTPEHFRNWSPLPATVSRVSYDVRDLFSQTGEADLLSATPAPDAFLQEEPSYVTWTPQIHRAPNDVK